MEPKPQRESRRHIVGKPVGAGMETVVFGHEVTRILKSGETVVGADTVEGKTVLKNYATVNDTERLKGFDQVLRDQMVEHYQAIRQQYGKKFFPAQRMLRLPNGRYLLVQERLTTAAQPDFMESDPAQLSDKTRRLAEELLAKRKASYLHYLDDPTDKTNRHLDFFGKSNIVVTDQGDLQFVDTSPKYGDYKTLAYPIPNFLGTTARFECALGTDPGALVQDPFYAELVNHPRFAPLKKLIQKPTAFRKALKELILSGILVVDKSDRR